MRSSKSVRENRNLNFINGFINVNYASIFVYYLEEVRLHLANAGLCELLIELTEKHGRLVDDDETRNLLKMACDLIIIILNGGNKLGYLKPFLEFLF